MKRAPLVSVVSIFLNAERFIEEAIESVLAQTHANWELLLIDDGGTDGSTEIALRYAERYPERIRYLHHPLRENRGLSASRNLGVANARGDYVAFLDADDVYRPDKLRHQVAELESQPRAALTFGPTLIWFSWSGNPDESRKLWNHQTELPGEPGTLIEPPELFLELIVTEERLTVTRMPTTCSVLARREVITDVGGFDDSLRDYDDFFLWAKIFLKFPVLLSGYCMAKYRRHEQSWSATLSREERLEWQPEALRHLFLDRVERHVSSQGMNNGRLWTAIQRELEPYRYPTAPTEIEERSDLKVEAGQLAAHVDSPSPGSRLNGHAIEVAGWVVGRESPLAAVEVESEGRVVGRWRALRRPDLPAAFPGVPGAENGGFRGSVSIAGTGALELSGRAVLEDQTRVPFATLTARRIFREGDRECGTPLVSVVVTSSDEGALLAGTIESVLAQTYPRVEILVVDNGSSGETASLVRSYPVRYVQADPGSAAARNRGLRLSRGTYLVFLDAGQQLLPTALDAGVASLASSPECGFTVGEHGGEGIDFGSLLRNGTPGSSAAITYDRFALESVGGFATGFDGAEGYELQLRLSRRFPVAHHDQRIVGGSSMNGPGPRDGTAKDALLAVLRSNRQIVRRDKRLRAACEEGIRRLSDGHLGTAQRRLNPFGGRTKTEARALVLLYHRVAQLDSDPWDLSVSPEHFAQHLEVLREEWRPLSLEQLARAIAKGKVPDRSVAVTFDDGYEDNLLNAAPLLERCQIPATCFLITGQLERSSELWWDELERLLLQPGLLPQQLRLRVDGRWHEWDLGEAAEYGPEAFHRWRHWRTGQEAPTARHVLYGALHRLLQPMSETHRNGVLEQMIRCSGDTPGEERRNHRTLSVEEVLRLSESALIEIGAHTVTHPLLRPTPPHLQEVEIRKSKASLEALLDRPITSFSYPYGNYSPKTVSLVRAAGFNVAGCADGGVISASTDLFHLPRNIVGDWPGEKFAVQLAEWKDRATWAS